jgi:hypothetical protein
MQTLTGTTCTMSALDLDRQHLAQAIARLRLAERSAERSLDRLGRTLARIWVLVAL